MRTLKEIKNNYAQVRGYDDWNELANSVQDDLEYEEHWTEICIRAHKAALEKAAEKIMRLLCLVTDIDSTLFHHNHSVDGWHLNGDLEPIMNFVAEMDMQAIPDTSDYLESITNPENLIR